MRFDPSRLGIRHQLLGLFGLCLVTGGLVLALDEVGEYYTQRSMSAMKDDVLAGMRSIRRLSDAYSQDVVDRIRQTKLAGGRVIAIGTTAVRTLESAAKSGALTAGSGWSELFIYPGYTFKVVDALVTNFHLPQSTLLMLVSAFAGIEPVRHAYQEAVRLRYRFFSFGDAMFIE